MLAAASAAAAFAGQIAPAQAIVRPTPEPTVHAAPNAFPTTSPNALVLPLNSSLFFVLDETVSSHSKPGTVVRAHLRDAIVLDRQTIAPAGTPVEIEVTQSSAAQAGNVDGSVEIFFRDLHLSGGRNLPLTTPSAHIDPHMSAGRASTRNVTDTVGDIFIPGHLIYHMLRKGSDVTLKPGTIIRARTAATLSMAHGVLAIARPAPFVTNADKPHATFSAAPIATPPGFEPRTPKPTPTGGSE